MTYGVIVQWELHKVPTIRTIRPDFLKRIRTMVVILDILLYVTQIEKMLYVEQLLPVQLLLVQPIPL